MQLTARQQEVLQRIQSDPASSLREIATDIGISHERVRQIAVKLTDLGAMENRRVLKEKAHGEAKTAHQAAIEQKKSIWRRMIFISRRQVYRHMARINQYGLAEAHHQPGQEAVCLYKNCTRPVDARGYCGLHYGKLRSTGALWVRRASRSVCKEQGCFYPVYARDICRNHYGVFKRKNPTKSILPHHNKSGYRGVSWRESDNRWAANILRPGDRQEQLGTFESKEMAARAYDTAARKYLGERAKLNFPDETIEVVKEKRDRYAPLGISGYRGIEWKGNKKRWIVRIWHDGKQIYIGQFTDLEHAARVQDSAARYYLGDTAHLNFPDEPVLPFTERFRMVAARKPGGSSQYRGVTKKNDRWCARIEVKGKSIRLGSFGSEEEAARAYDKAAIEHFKDNARLNFPDADYQRS